MMAGILDLPTELITGILQYLDDRDIFAARQTSTHVERTSFSFFAKRFFRKKGYLITSKSLHVLSSVAAHHELRKHVQHVWFNPDCFTFATPDYVGDTNDENDEEAGVYGSLGDPVLKPGSDLSDVEMSRYQAYRDCLLDHAELLYTGRLEDELTAALRTLPNLKAIGMRRSEDHRPWGWRLLRDAVGHDPRDLGLIPTGPMRKLSGPTQLFIGLIRSLAASGVQLQRLYTDAVEIDNIPSRTLPDDMLVKACNSILYIELNATKGWLEQVRMPATRAHYRCLDDPRQYGEGLSRLLNATPNLREIGLQIFPDRKQSHLIPPLPRQPDSWRQSYQYLAVQHLVSHTHFSHLRRVKLEKFTTSPVNLIAMLKPSATSLTSLKLRDIRLLPDKALSANPTQSQQQEHDQARPWQPVFAFLPSCHNLTYLLLNHLTHPTGSIRFIVELIPLPPPDPSVPRLETVANAGDFADYDNITVEAGRPNWESGKGLLRQVELREAREEVQRRVQGLAEGHWYGRNIFSYAMDETIWHTDTSDEEW